MNGLNASPFLQRRLSYESPHSEPLLSEHNPDTLIRRKEEVWSFLNIAFPTILSCIMELLPNTLAVAFVGQFCTKEELDGASLGTMFSNVVGLSLGLGFTSALAMMGSHAHGAGNTKLIGVYLQRMFMLLCCMFVPICFLNWYTSDILIALGQPKDVSLLAGRFTKYMLPSIFLIWMYDIMRKALQIQGRVKPMVFIALFSNSLSILLCYTMLKYSSMGYVSAALARSLAAASLPVLMLIYLRVTKVYREFWGGFSMKEAFSGWYEMCKVGLPGMFAVCLEWWAFEIMALICGLTDDPNTAIGANAILLQTTSLLYMIYLGISIATNVRVGVSFGANDPARAKLAAKIGMGCALVSSSVLGLLLFVGRYQVAAFYTKDETLRQAIVDSLWLVAMYQLPDSLKEACSGIFKASGMQVTAASIIFAAYYLIGLPLGCLFAFGVDLFDDQVTGLWMVSFNFSFDAL